jgi:uncharacterized RDD family membrane protein YckC
MSDVNYGAAPGYPPPPSYGPLASWGERVVATLIDWAIVFVGYIVVLIVASILGQIASVLGVLVGLIGYLGLLGASLYFSYLNGSTGQSPGKRLTGLKVISEDTGGLIGGGAGIGRGLLHIIDSAICYIGFLFPLWDAKRQTIADKIIKTVVVTGAPKQPFGVGLVR